MGHTMNIKLLGAAAVAAAAMCVGQAQAGQVFQSIPDLSAAPLQNAWCSDCFGGGATVYDTFTLSSAATLTGLQFDVQTDYFFPTDVTVSIYAGNSLAPGATLFSQLFPVGSFNSVTNTAFDTSIVDVSLPSVALAAGTYAISFYNPSNLGVPGYAGGAGLETQNGFELGNSAGFALDANAVPEPATWAMMMGGLFGMGLVLRKRRQGVAAVA